MQDREQEVEERRQAGQPRDQAVDTWQRPAALPLPRRVDQLDLHKRTHSVCSKQQRSGFNKTSGNRNVALTTEAEARCKGGHMRHRDVSVARRMVLFQAVLAPRMDLFQAALAPRVDLISSACVPFVCMRHRDDVSARCCCCLGAHPGRSSQRQSSPDRGWGPPPPPPPPHPAFLLQVQRKQSYLSVVIVFERAENSRQQRTVFAPAAAAAAAAPAPLPTSQAAAVGVRPL